MKHDWRSRSGCFAASPLALRSAIARSGCFVASPLWGGSFGASCSVRKAHSLFLFTLPLCIIGSLTYINTVTAQQVTSDGTVSTTVTTPDGKNFNIDDGTRRGGNLFHSFKDFSVPNGGSAVFNNPTDVQNIISRVTGGAVSDINGLIQAQGKANLFLLNPAGIVFGPNASLNIGGSFLGSTANSFVFDNGFEFSATNPQAAPLLTINIPIGLRYGDNPQNITNNTNVYGLEVNPGNSLALVGGNVSLDGGILFAPGGRVELGGLSAPGTVGLNTDGNNLVGLRFPTESTRADVSLTNRAFVDVSAGGGGSIAVNARNLDISGESALYAGINQGLGSVGSQVGDITLKASGTTTVANSFIFNYVDSGAVGNSGNLTIETQKFRASDGAQIATFIFGQGNAGNLTIKADELVEVIGTEKPNQTVTLVVANLGSGGEGKGGDLTIDTKKLVVRNAQVGASTFGKGDAGNLTVLATDSVELSGEIPGNENGFPGGLFAQVDVTGEGSSGNLTIKTGRLSVSDGSKVQVSTFGQGDAGNLLIQADDVDVFETSKYNYYSTGIFADVTTDPKNVDLPKGNGGNLTIETGRLRIRDGAQVSASSDGIGNAGTLLIRATDSVEVVGTEKPGRESSLRANVRSGGTGEGGDLTIKTKKLIVRDGGRVTVSTQNTKPAGNLEIYADSINLDNQGTITATSKSGNGGNITLGVRDLLLLRRGSEISTTAGTAGTGGDGGNITINSPLIVAFPNENSDITANAFSGSGGKITIKTQGLFGITPLSRQELEQRLNTTDSTQLDPRNLPTSDITAISQNNPNLSGTVNINPPDVDPSQGLFELRETVIDPAQQIAQNPCLRGGGEFIITGRGGFPSNPNQIFSSDNVRVDLVKPVASKVSSTSTTQKQSSTSATAKEIVPARGWIFTEKGEVMLVAYDPTKTGVQREQPTPASSCAAVR